MSHTNASNGSKRVMTASQQDADLGGEAYKARMKRLLWSTVPETYLSKNWDGSPNTAHGRADPRILPSDARRIITISQRLTDCELSLAPPQHIPEDAGEMTRRLGMLYGYALVEPAKNDKKRRQQRLNKKRSLGGMGAEGFGAVLAKGLKNDLRRHSLSDGGEGEEDIFDNGDEDVDDDEDAPSRPGERGMGLERRRKERWLRLQREKRQALLRAEAESKATRKRGAAVSNFAPLNSKLILDHQKKRREQDTQQQRRSVAAAETEAETARQQRSAPPSNFLSSGACHVNYLSPSKLRRARELEEGMRRAEGHGSGSDDSDAEEKAIPSSSPPFSVNASTLTAAEQQQPHQSATVGGPASATAVNASRLSVGRHHHHRKLSVQTSPSGEATAAAGDNGGVLQPRAGSTIANLGGHTVSYAIGRQPTATGVGASSSSLVIVPSKTPANASLRRTSTANGGGDGGREALRKTTLEREADVVFKMANGKHPLVFRATSPSSPQRGHNTTDGGSPASPPTSPSPTANHQKSLVNATTILSVEVVESLRKAAEDQMAARNSPTREQHRSSASLAVSTSTPPTMLTMAPQTASSPPPPAAGNASACFSSALLLNATALSDASSATVPTTPPSYESPDRNPFGFAYDPMFGRLNEKERRRQLREARRATLSSLTQQHHLLATSNGALGVPANSTSIVADSSSNNLRQQGMPLPLPAEPCPPQPQPSLLSEDALLPPPPEGASMDQCLILNEDDDAGGAPSDKSIRRLLEKVTAAQRLNEGDQSSSSSSSSEDGEAAGGDSDGKKRDRKKKKKSSHSPTRRMLRVPKRSRWLRAFDTALMVSEALHSVESSRHTPTVSRCAPDMTASKDGELSARAAPPPPPRLTVPVTWARETREKLELAHMAPVMTPDGTDALRSVYGCTIRPNSRSGSAASPKRSTSKNNKDAEKNERSPSTERANDSRSEHLLHGSTPAALALDYDDSIYEAEVMKGRPRPTRARSPPAAHPPQLLATMAVVASHSNRAEENGHRSDHAPSLKHDASPLPAGGSHKNKRKRLPVGGAGRLSPMLGFSPPN